MAGELEPMVHALRRCVLFAECSSDELARIVPLLEDRMVAAAATIVGEGDPATELFVIRTGKIEVTKRATGSARDHRLTTLGPGATFGELTFVDRGPRSASVRALEPTTLAVLSMAALDRATADDAGLRAHMLRGLAGFLAHRLIVDALPFDAHGTVRAEVVPRRDLTVYARIGDAFAWACVLATVITDRLSNQRRRRRAGSRVPNG